ncbi:MAG: threonine dehydratase [Acidobacteria bacterium]|nr:threonine dehydratase [Acidobacteriota bacterium]
MGRTDRAARALRRIPGARVVGPHARRVAPLHRVRPSRRPESAGLDRGPRARRGPAARLGRRRADHRPAGCGGAAVPIPTLTDVVEARARVRQRLPPTPLLRHPLLNAETGLDIRVKHENHNPTGAFKIRGGINLIAGLSPEERRRGVVTASTGNHGQSIALACRDEGIACTVVVPAGNNPEKNAAMRALGAEVLEHGRDFDEAREHVEALQRAQPRRYVHSANEPLLIAGVGTYALEIFEAQPETDVIIVPIGGGSGACGCAVVRSGLGSRARIVGVQAARADAFARSWLGRCRIAGDAADTFAEGIATRVTFDLTFGILRRELDAVVTLGEAELQDGVRLALRATHNLAEGAGAASLAAAVKLRDTLAGKRVVCVMSGGNIDTATLRRILAPPA